MQLEPQSYSYPEDYQKKLAAVIIRDPVFLIGHTDVIDPLFFDYDYLSSIVRLAREYADQYSVVPTRETFQQLLTDHCTKFNINASIRDEFLVQVDVLYNMNLTDSESVQNEIVKFGKRQALRCAVAECATLVTSNRSQDLDKARGIIDEALCVGENVNDLGFNFFPNIDQIPSLVANDSAYSTVKRIPTGFPSLDRCCYGGPGRKQVWSAMGLAGGGKSTVLTNIGAAALKKGMHVVHYTLGDLQQVDVALRYAARLTGVTQDEISRGDFTFYRRAENLKKLTKNLLVKYYPSQAAFVSTLRSHLTQVRAVAKFQPALIIVDYADELAEMRVENKYHAGGEVYGGLNRLAHDFDALVWTATQVGRYAPKTTEEDIIKKENVADSWMKAAKADGLISINQTQQEYEAGRGRIWVDKVRRGKSFHKFKIKIDLSRALIREVDMETETPATPPPAIQQNVFVPPPPPSAVSS